MKKVLSTLTALSIALTLTACTKTEEPSSEISDPFSDLSAPDPDSGVWDDSSDLSSSAPVDEKEYLRALSNCEASVSINTLEDIVYDGEPVKVPIAVTANDRKHRKLLDRSFRLHKRIDTGDIRRRCKL